MAEALRVAPAIDGDGSPILVAPIAVAPIVVLKFGSSVLRSEADLAAVVHAIYAWVRRGHRVVAVVSAIGDATDRLLARGRALSTANEHALAALLATGEAQSTALLALALARAGIPAHGADPHALALRTRGPALDAEPIGIDGARVRRLLAQRPVLVVPGFVGIDDEGHPTLLGRGGSDLTAVFLAGALGARACVLYKDVGGLYDRDPAHHGALAQRFATASYADALAHGGRLLQDKAVTAARAAGVGVTITNLAGGTATQVHAGPSRAASDPEPSPLRVGLLGAGTVGVGVLDRVRALADQFTLVAVAVRTPGDPRRAAVAEPLVDAATLCAAECDVLVDASGDGATVPALLAAALARGVSVVSANKAALARELPRLRRAAAAGKARLLYSAAVGGAVPMLGLAQRLRPRGIDRVEAILNTTTNHVLAAVAAGSSLAAAVTAARAAGFAEGDVARDLDGRDAADKLVLLAEAAFGSALAPAAVARADLRTFDLGRCHAAARAGAELRFVATLQRRGRDLAAAIEPRVLAPDDPLFGTAPADNKIVVRTLEGALHVATGGGAGRWPTTEAIVGDLLELWRARGAATDAPVCATTGAEPRTAGECAAQVFA